MSLSDDQMRMLHSQPGDRVDVAMLQGPLAPYIESFQAHGDKLLNLKLSSLGEEALKLSITNE